MRSRTSLFVPREITKMRLDDTFSFLPLIFSSEEKKDRKRGAFLVVSCRFAVARFPRSSWPTFTRLPSSLCSLHTSRGCNLRLTERKPKGSDRVVTRSVHIGSLNEETRRRNRLFLRRLLLLILVRFSRVPILRCAFIVDPWRGFSFPESSCP